jgi:hypothetical protein
MDRDYMGQVTTPLRQTRDIGSAAKQPDKSSEVNRQLGDSEHLNSNKIRKQR